MIDTLAATLTGPAGTLLLASEVPISSPGVGPSWAGLIVLFPVLSVLLCGLCMALRVRTRLPGALTVICLSASFVVTLLLYVNYMQETGPCTVHLLDWFDLRWSDGPNGSLLAGISLYVDSLTLLWMLFVTGLGALIALYSVEYMEADVGGGYPRFFAGVSIFLVAMTCLVMADNLLLLYLGWEGVGFASYWLIGYYYQRPSAVAAAKKAFIVNRIGDLGLALAIYLIWFNFGTLQYADLFTILDGGEYPDQAGGWSIQAIPFLVMLGAFGKSAQIPLYVWLPDAMEGPTPVSALIHAATMVTAGVYLLCRTYPLMELHPAALPTVAWVGALTALLAASIGMLQYDIKRIMAYSTVSQLGYMFLGIGVGTTVGAAYHVFTHAFFKAVLFLTCGAIMHGFAGQLDLRKISGLRFKRGWKITSYTMLYACLCLVGFPIISNGFYSKDMIMAQPFISHGPGFTVLGVVGVVTALLTAYYAFRVWFRVCSGPVYYEMGDEHHGDDDEHGAARPHAPRLAINATLVLITIGAIISIVPHYTHWVDRLIADSSAAIPAVDHGAVEHAGFMADPHQWMPWLASGVGILGILVAWYFHQANRALADELKNTLLARPATRWLPLALENKWYVDEIYHAIIRAPLWVLGHLLNLLDRWIVDGLIIDGLGRLPRLVGRIFQPLQNGILQSYAVSMAGGAGLVALLVLYIPVLFDWLRGILGGAG
jgi:NADH-quinone oxidoreductase subunit L